MNLCPTTPVAPRMPIGSFLFINGYLDSTTAVIPGSESNTKKFNTTVRSSFCRWNMREDHHARASTELLHQRMGHHRHRACQASRGIGYTSAAANRVIVRGDLSLLPG